jgi:hypothetical protein
MGQPTERVAGIADRAQQAAARVLAGLVTREEGPR